MNWLSRLHVTQPVAQATVDHQTLEFVKELGLILFVFTIGLQLGPGFLAALKRDGCRLNAVAAGLALFGTGVAMALAWLPGIDLAGALGCLPAPRPTRRPSVRPSSRWR